MGLVIWGMMLPAVLGHLPIIWLETSHGLHHMGYLWSMVGCKQPAIYGAEVTHE